MRFNRHNPIYTAAVILGSLFCIFTIVSFFPAVFPYLDQLWWTNFSTVTDIIGMLGYLTFFIYLMTGRGQLDEDRIADRVVDKIELRRRYQNLDEIPQQVEIPEEIDNRFAISRLDIVIGTLRNSEFSENAIEFEAVQSLVSNGYIIDAVIRTRRSMEMLFKDILNRRDKRPGSRRFLSLRVMVDALVSQQLLTDTERSLFQDYISIANKAVHGRDPAIDEATTIISIVSDLVNLIVLRHEERLQ